MALANYSDLKTGIGLWQHKTQSGFTARYDDFISLFEASANATIRVRENETETTLTATASSPHINLPSNFQEHVWLKVTSTQRRLTYVTPDALPYYPSTGPSERWTIVDSRVRTELQADQAYGYTLRYHKVYAIATDTTNALLTRYPNVYLYGCLLEAAPFVQDENTLVLWQNRYDRAKRELDRAESRYKSKATLAVDPGLISAGAFNINTGA